MISGSVKCDLTAVHEDRMRHRLYAVLSDTPTGARLVLHVGALIVDPPALDLLLQHTDRLSVDVQGEARAVRTWVAALRTGDVMAASGWSP